MSLTRSMGITYLNRTAEKILDRYELPVEIPNICKRIFDSIKNEKVNEIFPGDIVLYQKIERVSKQLGYQDAHRERTQCPLYMFS